MRSISGVHMDIYYHKGAINFMEMAVVHLANHWQKSVSTLEFMLPMYNLKFTSD